MVRRSPTVRGPRRRSRRLSSANSRSRARSQSPRPRAASASASCSFAEASPSKRSVATLAPGFRLEEVDPPVRLHLPGARLLPGKDHLVLVIVVLFLARRRGVVAQAAEHGG